MLANRLSEHNSVLLLESGGDEDNNPLSFVPRNAWPEVHKSELDWGYHTSNEVKIGRRIIASGK